METKLFIAPALYGDHHVTEVRRMLLEIPGVKEVYASSAFQVIEVKFDPKKIAANQIGTRLKEAGYMEEIPVPAELGAAIEKSGDDFFRRTVTYETTKQTVSFAQQVQAYARPLWPCPGMGVIKSAED